MDFGEFQISSKGYASMLPRKRIILNPINRKQLQSIATINTDSSHSVLLSQFLFKHKCKYLFLNVCLYVVHLFREERYARVAISYTCCKNNLEVCYWRPFLTTATITMSTASTQQSYFTKFCTYLHQP